jgi:hypothetical protein
MKRNMHLWSIFFLLLLWLLAAHTLDPKISGPRPQPVVGGYGHLPLSFEINQGQTDKRVNFLSRGSGYSLFLTGNEAVVGSIAQAREVVRLASIQPDMNQVRHAGQRERWANVLDYSRCVQFSPQ